MSKETATHAAKSAPAGVQATYAGYLRPPGSPTWGAPVCTGQPTEALARQAIGTVNREQLDQLGFPYGVSTQDPNHALVLQEGRDADTEKPPADIDPQVAAGKKGVRHGA
jgi:hypothetical protein